VGIDALTVTEKPIEARLDSLTAEKYPCLFPAAVVLHPVWSLDLIMVDRCISKVNVIP
jgi:zona occludens toxin (predicted ATPase)